MLRFKVYVSVGVGTINGIFFLKTKNALETLDAIYISLVGNPKTIVLKIK